MRHPCESGFTLVELVVILIVTGILAVAVVPPGSTQLPPSVAHWRAPLARLLPKARTPLPR